MNATAPTRLAALLFVIAAGSAAGQATLAGTPAAPKDPDKGKYVSPKFWENSEPFELSLSVNMKTLMADKGDPGPWRSVMVSYANGAEVRTHPARVRTRGRSRLKICDRFPPVWVDFQKEDLKGTELQRLNRFKLVAPCKFAPDFERYVLSEYNIYRIHQLFTPVSHRVRLLKLTVKDSASGKEQFSKYAFALEDVDEVAERLGATKMAVTGLTATDLAQKQTALMGVLAYMVGNTDFSFSARHNLEFIPMNGTIFPIIFDYDASGLVNTTYSIPDPSLGIRSVTQRVFRGLCVDPDSTRAAIAEVKAKRPEIEALYRDELGKLLGGQTVSYSLRYLNGFFEDIENPKTVQKQILEKCANAR